MTISVQTDFLPYKIGQKIEKCMNILSLEGEKFGMVFDLELEVLLIQYSAAIVISQINRCFKICHYLLHIKGLVTLIVLLFLFLLSDFFVGFRLENLVDIKC